MQRTEPYSHGLATSILQDAAETFLRILAAELGVNVHANESFSKVLGDVGAKIASVTHHRASLSRLNSARVMFKHQGLSAVQRNDVIVFFGNVESFLTDVCMAALSIDFASVTLADAIGHRRTQNWIEKAEQALSAGEFDDALRRASGAMAIYLAHSNDHDYVFDHSTHLSPPFDRQMFSPHIIGIASGVGTAIDIEWQSAITDFASWAKAHIENTRDRVHLMARGVDVGSYDKFSAITHKASITGGGSFRFISNHANSPPTEDDVRFCIDVVIDSALALRNHRPPSPWQLNAPKSKVKVIHQAEIVVNARQNPLETIRTAEPNEVLDSPADEPFSVDGDYIDVLQDGDVAYARKDCVEDLSSGPSAPPTP